MRRFLLASTTIVGVAFGLAGSASAQSYYDPPVSGDYYGPPATYEPGYTTYGYTEYPSGSVRQFYYRPDIPPGGCGTYRFYRNGRCIDARYR